MEASPRAAPRRAHPELVELAGGVRLSAEAIRSRSDGHRMETFVQMLENAEYWLSFDLHAFEPVLTTAPSPLRELGVAVALKFNDRPDGLLGTEDVNAAQQFLLRRIAPDLRPGVTEALQRLSAIVELRDRKEALFEDGYLEYAPEPALSVHALRAMGRATILVDGAEDDAKVLALNVGQPVHLSAIDEKQRPLDPPEIETDTGAPLWIRPRDDGRDVLFLVPGAYRLRVRGRASGDKKVMVR